MNINKDIKDLLQNCECVILPEIGGFIANKKSATIIETESGNIFRPPSKEVMFNSSLITNDGVLSNFIANKYQDSYENANSFVLKFSEELKSKLNKGEQIYFDQVGTLSYDNNSKIIFTPDLSDNLLIESFGLESFDILPINTDNQKNDTDKLKGKFITIKFNIGNVIKKSSIAIAAAILIGVVLFATNRDYTVSNNINRSSFNPINKIKTLFTKNTSQIIKNNTEYKSTNKLIKDNKDLTPILKTPVNILEFYIIVGSFTNYRYASKLNETLQKKGYKSEVLNNDNSLYRVSIESFADKNSALKSLNTYNLQNINSTIWIMKKTNSSK